MKTLVTVGDLVVDFLLDVRLPVVAGGHQTARSLRFEAGGACTTIFAARGMGLAVSALGAVGDDVPGRFLLGELADADVDVGALQVPAGSATTTVISLSDSDKGGHVFLGRYGEGSDIDFDESAAQGLERADAVFVPGYTLLESRMAGLVDGALDWLARNRRRVYFDVGPFLGDLPRQLIDGALRHVDTLLLTEDEIAFVADDMDELLARHGQLTVILKLGADGCRIVSRDEAILCPGFAAEVIDTIGAGDAFAAAWIWADLNGRSPRDCGTIANAMGAASVMRAGAGRNSPTCRDVQAILDANNTGIVLTC